MATPESVPVLHAVTDDGVLARTDFLALARQVMDAGGPSLALHLRGPRTSARRLYALASALRDALGATGGWLMVNDRADVARAAGAHGVQVGQRGLTAADARQVMGEGWMLGVSIHTVDEARAAFSGRPDFLVAGTIWETASHPGRTGAGTGFIREVAALGVPTIAIGGVTPGRMAEARDAGAAGGAVLRGVWNAPDPAAAVREYLSDWKG